MTTNHTPGTWRAGKTGESVVSDQPLPGYDAKGGHDHVEYYGGYLIAESIWRAEDRALIVAAPDLLEALEKRAQVDAAYARLAMSEVEHDDHERLLQQIEQAEDAAKAAGRAAIAKAQGETQ